MNYGKIKKRDIANGSGIRVSLFVSGCTHHCKGCFNSELWDFSHGKPFTVEIQNEIINALAPSYIQGLTLLGGEPFETDNQKELLSFIKKVKEIYPSKNIWCFTGYTFETDLLSESKVRCEITHVLLSYIDILVDGKFEENLKDISLAFRGSSNQRIIDVKKSLDNNCTILWNIPKKEI